MPSASVLIGTGFAPPGSRALRSGIWRVRPMTPDLKTEAEKADDTTSSNSTKKKAASMADSRSKKSTAADDEDMDPMQYFENRLKYLGALRATGEEPYPHKFPVTMSIPEYVEKYNNIGNGEHLEDDTVNLAGRIMSKRSSSSKLFFYDLHGGAAKVQVMADARYAMSL